eukprot:TRINITY_DN43681_c0_g1_i1.p1 TRINITY_DN43681_c0_g1~~TRINITY_DN43681_c0_g1_i1.p1  ORF type:complete len:260 (+),score=27.68 TRINITY_DN43681_c0_g1_i1:89-868(+)
MDSLKRRSCRSNSAVGRVKELRSTIAAIQASSSTADSLPRYEDMQPKRSQPPPKVITKAAHEPFIPPFKQFLSAMEDTEFSPKQPPTPPARRSARPGSSSSERAEQAPSASSACYTSGAASSQRQQDRTQKMEPRAEAIKDVSPYMARIAQAQGDASSKRQDEDLQLRPRHVPPITSAPTPADAQPPSRRQPEAAAGNQRLDSKSFSSAVSTTRRPHDLPELRFRSADSNVLSRVHAIHDLNSYLSNIDMGNSDEDDSD